MFLSATKILAIKILQKKKDKKLSDKEKRQANSCVQTFGVNPLDLSE